MTNAKRTKKGGCFEVACILALVSSMKMIFIHDLNEFTNFLAFILTTNHLYDTENSKIKKKQRTP